MRKWIVSLMLVAAAWAPGAAAAETALECEKKWDGRRGKEVLHCEELDAHEKPAMRPRSRRWDPITMAAQTGAAALVFVPSVFVGAGLGSAYSAAGGWRLERSDYAGHSQSVGFSVSQALVPTTTTLVGRLVGGSGPWWSIAVGSGAGALLGLPLAFAIGDPGLTAGVAYGGAFIGSMMAFHLAAKPEASSPATRSTVEVSVVPTNGGLNVGFTGRF